MPHNLTFRTLADAGFSPDLGDKLEAGRFAGLLRHLHAVLVGRAGALVMERYYEGADESWGRQLGTVQFDADSLHDLRLVTKSVIGLLYGIALDRGLVPSPDALLLAQFPGYSHFGDPRLERLLVRHALTMTLGMEWDEQRPYTDPENSEIAMENAPDRLRYILERPFAAEPGSRWIYSGGAVAMLGSLISRGTGLTLQEFARDVLFSPLGIETFEWARGGDGVASAASGLRLLPRDLLRIGMMVLNRGRIGDRRVVYEEWLDASFSSSADTGDGLGYGYLWFLGQTSVPFREGSHQWIGGFGNGGQRLWLLPEADLAVVILSGNYDAPDAWETPARICSELVLANLGT